ncbi:MAG: hypothetical protein ACHQCF_01135 [Solirubrobacterales bacterium]
MGRRPGAMFMLVGVLVLFGVGRARADHFSITYPKGPDPAVSEWPTWSYPVSCGGLEFDPVAAFGGPTEAEEGSGGPEIALARYLDAVTAETTISRKYWRLVAATETRAEYAEGRLAQGPLWIAFELSGDEWRPAGGPHYCEPRTVREGRLAGRWTLAGSQVIGKNTRRIQVVPGGAGCNGGRSVNAMVEKPVFTQVGRKLVMTIWLEPLPPGIYTCQALVEPPLSVKLPGRLGNRRLYDGATYPPRVRQ